MTVRVSLWQCGVPLADDGCCAGAPQPGLPSGHVSQRSQNKKSATVDGLIRCHALSGRVKRLSALKSTTLITKAKRIPLVDLTPCVIDLTQEE